MVKFKNESATFGLVSILLHWLIALMTISLFILGLWMVDLGYYDDWYQRGPWIHKSIGFIVFALLLARFLWSVINPAPNALPSHKRWETLAAHLMQILLNVALLVICITGYFIVTAQGGALTVFDLINIPAINIDIDNLEDLAGKIHYILACILIIMVSIHALASLKHHFIDKDRTLLRILGLKTKT